MILMERIEDFMDFEVLEEVTKDDDLEFVNNIKIKANNKSYTVPLYCDKRGGGVKICKTMLSGLTKIPIIKQITEYDYRYDFNRILNTSMPDKAIPYRLIWYGGKTCRFQFKKGNKLYNYTITYS